MKSYYRVELFDENACFSSGAISQAIAKGNRYFFSFFPRKCQLIEIIEMQKFFSKHKDLSFCIHDKTPINQENEINISNNLVFYHMLCEAGMLIENISFHLGSLIGFGAEKNIEHVESLIEDSFKKEISNQRFLISKFSNKSYEEHLKMCVVYIKKIAAILKKKKIRLLIKNLSVDYVLASEEQKEYFERLGYTYLKLKKNLFSFPILLEKGDLPRSMNEMKILLDQCDIGIALDVDHLKNMLLLSNKYNVNDKKLLREWGVKFSEKDLVFLKKYGFSISGKSPVFYQEQMNFYDQIDLVKDKIEIVHLSGSVGPVFVDKKNLEFEEVTSDMLMGQLSKLDIPFAIHGKNQEITFVNLKFSSKAKKNFTYEATQQIWEEIFKRQFLENILLFKEIGCLRMVQKSKKFIDDSIKIYEFFDNLASSD